MNPNKVPSGLSWGMRGFRIGKSSYGNWWISIGLPFGFRYTWFLGKKPFGIQPKIEEVPLQQEVNEVIESPSSSVDDLVTRNKQVLKKMKE